jgi:hypothetical protein
MAGGDGWREVRTYPTYTVGAVGRTMPLRPESAGHSGRYRVKNLLSSEPGPSRCNYGFLLLRV